MQAELNTSGQVSVTDIEGFPGWTVVVTPGRSGPGERAGAGRWLTLPPPGSSASATDASRLPYGAIFTMAQAADEDPAIAVTLRSLGGARGRPLPKSATREDLEEVARVYTAALRHGAKGWAAVMAYFALKHKGNAERYITRAVRAGALDLDEARAEAGANTTWIINGKTLWRPPTHAELQAEGQRLLAEALAQARASHRALANKYTPVPPPDQQNEREEGK